VSIRPVWSLGFSYGDFVRSSSSEGRDVPKLPWQTLWPEGTWRDYLRAGERESDLLAIRRWTYTGRPLGTAEFIKELEKKTRRRLALRKGGHPRKPTGDAQQGELTFDA
jgi:hypothetical protein